VFTGIVEDVGTVRELAREGETVRLVVEAATLDGLSLGGSISVSGCCLTAVAAEGRTFTAQLTPETLARTAFADLREGSLVNLERPLRADGRFDGHIVQGHVDGVGRIADLRRLGSSAELVIEPPPDLEKYLVAKGSIAVDGISLTVAAVGDSGFAVAVIPYTLEKTTLRAARPGGRVNLEADVIAKYVERLLAAGGDPRRARKSLT